MTRWLPTLWPVLSGAIVGLAFLFPESGLSLGLGWLAAHCLAHCYDAKISWRGWSVFGLVLGAIGFYWLPYTLKLFGGFPQPLALALFFLFTLTIAAQFALMGVLAAWLERNRFLSQSLLAFPLAWFAVEFLFPRLFPWTLAHTQIVWASFSSLAELMRAEFLTAFMLWCAAVAIAVSKTRRLPVARFAICAPLTLFIAILWGSYRTEQVRGEMERAPGIRVGLIQGNLDVFEKRSAASVGQNLAKHQELSREALSKGAQILLWPESVLADWIPLSLTKLRGTRFDPFPNSPVPILFGGLSFSPRAEAEHRKLISGAWGEVSAESKEQLKFKLFNTAFGLNAAGEVLGFYHKKVLMPFGEFLPFARKIPAIRQLSLLSGDFDSGDLSAPIVYELPVAAPSGEVKRSPVSVMPLVCYEDLIPALTRDAVLRGASLLVNLTNDAWYGRSAAPFEHHLLAQWRAIETRRSLLRVTNTGYTAVVNPLGRTAAALPIFSSGELVVDVPLLSLTTPYVRYGDPPFTVLAWGVVLLAFVSRRRLSNLK